MANSQYSLPPNKSNPNPQPLNPNSQPPNPNPQPFNPNQANYGPQTHPYNPLQQYYVPPPYANTNYAPAPIPPPTNYGMPPPKNNVNYGIPPPSGFGVPPPTNYGMPPPNNVNYGMPPPTNYAPPQNIYPGQAAPAPFMQNNKNPGEEKEPMLLLDITGSMNYHTSATDPTPRKDTIREAILLLVKELGEKDSQGDREGNEGGLRTVTFSGGSATDIGDLNVKNLREKWSRITFAGGTHILPGWNKLFEVYMTEFGRQDPASRPTLMALIITDGEANDTEAFAAALSSIRNQVYAVVAVIGYGPDYDSAFQAYKQVETRNSHVRVIPFDSQSNPSIIAKTLIRMVE